MHSTKKKIFRIEWFLVSFLFFTCCIILNSFWFQTSNEKEFINFQNQINDAEQLLVKHHQTFKNQVYTSNEEEFWNINYFNHYVEHFLFTHDSLVFWSTNEIPISRRNDTLTFEKIANGYYFILSSSIEPSGLQLVSVIKIKNEFAFENEHLNNDLSPFFSLNSEIIFNEDCTECPAILNTDGIKLSRVEFKQQSNNSSNVEFLVYSLYLLGLICLLIGVLNILLISSITTWLKYGIIFTIFSLSWFLNQIIVQVYFKSFELFSPNLYASSEWLPNLGQLIFIVVIFGFLLKLINNVSQTLIENRAKKNSWIIAIGSIGILFLVGWLLNGIFKSLVINSTIPLEIQDFYSLNIYSFLTIFLIGYLNLLFILLTSILIRYSMRIELNKLAILIFFISILYSSLEIYFRNTSLHQIVWPITIICFVYFFQFREKKLFAFNSIVLLIALNALFTASILLDYNVFNEHQKRQLFAHQLISDKDIETEYEFYNLANQILNDSSLYDYSTFDYSGNFSGYLMECCTSKYWEKYDLDFNFFTSLNESEIDQGIGKTTAYFEDLINQHGVESELTKDLFFIKDNFEGISYIGKLQLGRPTDTAIIYIQLQNKRIPEQIGFPRILINASVSVLPDIDKYSFARYYDDKLIGQFGSQKYPLKLEKTIFDKKQDQSFFEDGLNNHFLYSNEDGNKIIISKSVKSNFEILTNFSYVFIIFSIMVIIFQLIQNGSLLSLFQGISLSLKIQIILISMLSISLIFLGMVTGSYMKDQYNEFSNSSLQEKLHSVEIEVKQKLGDNQSLDRIMLGDYMDYILKKFAKVFATDLNLYDLKGNLLSSSQPELYKKGIISTYMNPEAYNQLINRSSAEYIHKEKIGNLDYLSAYLPLNNTDGESIGMLNLQHFAKQNTYENQISGFLITIINISVLLLVVTVIFALFISNWLTKPLRMLQTSLFTIELGKKNEPINYVGNDEIGALVKEYNVKLEELEKNAIELARSERESAWREMAKQVAHEIKNPLTPMKLTIQQFNRAVNPSDPNFKEKLEKITNSLIEQIDTLSTIANEFSNFANMPKPKFSNFNIISLIESNIEIYQNDQVKITLNSEDDEYIIEADKEQLLRVLNNLISNAIQAKKDDEMAEIQISIHSINNQISIEIEDNGIGIPKQLIDRIFSPNFTTKSTGSGLGLAMVKQIILNHNGEISFSSTEGKGTKFRISLPLTFS